MEAVLLSKPDAELLKAFVAKLRKSRISDVPISSNSESSEIGDDRRPNQTYIALPLENGGIDGLVIVGPPQVDDATGKIKNGRFLSVPGHGDSPGVALCDIYRVEHNDDSNDPYAELALVSEGVKVFNLSQERLGRDWVPVTLTANGDYIAQPVSQVIAGLLMSKLTKSKGPLTHATVAQVLVVEYSNQEHKYLGILPRDVTELKQVKPNKWKATNRVLTVINRFSGFEGGIGTFGLFRKYASDLLPVALDCEVTNEGLHAVLSFGINTPSGGVGSSGTGGSGTGGGMGGGGPGDDGMGG